MVKLASFLLLFSILSPILVFAQPSEADIKLSGAYHWGEGYGEDQESAISSAKRALIEKMIVRISTDASLSESEQNDNFSSVYESTTTTMSRIELRGLDYLPPSQRRNGSWETLAFISKEKFTESMKVEEERLLYALELALANENEGRINTAIPEYFDIFASTFFFPTPFFTNVEAHGADAELKSFLSGRINNWMNGLQIEVDQVRSLSTDRNTELYIDLAVSYKSKGVDHLSISLNKPGYAKHPVRNGKVSVFSDMAPEQQILPYTVVLEPIIPSTIDQEKRTILKELLPIRELTLEVDFSTIIDIQVSTQRNNDDEITFFPSFKNLSVYSLEWEFGNGSTSTETNPVVPLTDFNAQNTVSLIINQSDVLTKTYRVNSNGRLSNINREDSSVDTPTEQEVENVLPTNNQEKRFEVPFSESAYLNNLIRMKTLNQLNGYLIRLNRDQIVDVGGSTSIDDPTKSYIAIIKPTNDEIVAILSPVKNGLRFNLLDQSNVENSKLRETYRGFGSVWFQFK